MQIAIAYTDSKVALWCDVKNIDKDGTIYFSVINGGWEGRYQAGYHDGTVYVEYTKETLPGMLVWVGDLSGHYNDVIPWIQGCIDDPDYVMTPPDQYVAPVRIKNDEYSGKQIIGYIVWDNGPVRNVRSEGQWFERKEPIKVYQTEKIALRYGSVVKPVFVEADA